MKSENLKIKYTATKKNNTRRINVSKHLLERLLNEMSYWKAQTERLQAKAWELRNLLENREWESSEKKMSLETHHSFILYKDRMNEIVKAATEIKNRMAQLANKQL